MTLSNLCYKSLVLISLACLTVPATAQTILPTQKYPGNTENEGTVLLDPDYGGPAGTSFLNVYIGAEDSLLSGYGGTPDPLQFDAYCIDLTKSVDHNTYPVSLLSTDAFPLGRPGVQHGGSLAWLYNNFAPTAVNDNRQAGALQLALWEAEYDWNGSAFVGGTNSSINLKSGYFQFGGVVAGNAVDTDLQNRANAMLTAWSGKQDTATWIADPTNTRQSLIGPKFIGPNVPEPGTVGLLLPGLGLIVGLVRYRKGR